MSERRKVALRLLHDREHYEQLVDRAIREAQVSVWIATANVKELLVEAPVGTRDRARGRYQSIVVLLADLVRRGVEVRLLHATAPSRRFEAARRRLDDRLSSALDLRQCPRNHLKMVAVDGALLYLGSANLTGAGLGAKGDGRRNFETGIVTDDEGLLDEMQARFDHIFRGRACNGCRLRAECPLPLDELIRAG
ncbi:MAG: phospholipase D family protein [Polyangiaceae bacterium]